MASHTNNLDNLNALLSSQDEEERRTAVVSLKHQADESALKYLDKALGDESWRVRKAAVEGLCAFPDRDLSAQTMISALGDAENAGRRSGAMEALTSLGRQALLFLHKSIHHPDGDVRKFVVDILGEIADPSSIDYIAPLTTDSSENIRLAAVEALGSIGGGPAFDKLIELLPSSDVSLQFSVLHSLGRIGEPIPIESIRPLFNRKILRRALYDALGQTKSMEAVEFLAQGVSDSTRSARQAAVRALYKLAKEPPLEGPVKRTVKSKLADKPLDLLAEFLEANHQPTRQATVALLSMIGTPEAAKVLLNVAHDDSLQADVSDALQRMKTAAPGMFDKVAEKEPRAKKEMAWVFKEAPAPETPLGPMSDDQFGALRDLVSEKSGLYYDSELKYLVERRVQRRMEAVSINEYDQYLELVAGNTGKSAKELKNLIGVLATNETYFFREDFQLRAFREEILPELIEERQNQKNRPIRVWSAGCSSGEEPYTIAILTTETPGNDQCSFEIIGSDISEHMIEQARAATYNASSFRSTDELYIKNYFQKEGGKYRLAEEVRQMVSFDNTNLMNCETAHELKELDVIFCRNVIIYFSADAKRSVVEQFYKLLKPGGYLLLGHSESLMSVSSDFELVHLKHDLVYRKPEAGP